jgi:hypothetical protein
MNAKAKPTQAPEQEPITITQGDLQKMLDEAVARGAEEGRLSREQEMRDSEPVHQEYEDIWEEPLMLDMSKVKKEGYRFRFGRTMIEGQPDEIRIAKLMNKGWSFVKTETLPKEVNVPSLSSFRGVSGVVGIHGLVLMERPEEICQREDNSIKARTRAQLKAVDLKMKEDAPNTAGFKSPVVAERKSKITRGREPNVPD